MNVLLNGASLRGRSDGYRGKEWTQRDELRPAGLCGSVSSTAFISWHRRCELGGLPGL